jgi:hypothetical protein
MDTRLERFTLADSLWEEYRGEKEKVAEEIEKLNTLGIEFEKQRQHFIRRFPLEREQH